MISPHLLFSTEAEHLSSVGLFNTLKIRVEETGN